mmetsp:Transcript_88363/g.276668  ORF Transcript_88363/g.276668 Transcript_88363/m.276668 type:complete len:298 (+) Transcript_88363:905-1798(+)
MLAARRPPSVRSAAAPVASVPSTRAQAAGRESAGRGRAPSAPVPDAALSSCRRDTAPRQFPPQAAAMASKDSGMGPSSSRCANSANMRATWAGLGQTSRSKQSFRTESRDSTVSPLHVRTMGCGDARTAGASLSLSVSEGSSGTSSTTTVSLPSVTSRAVRCLFSRLSTNFSPSWSSRLYSRTFLWDMRPTSLTPQDLPQPGRPKTRAAGGFLRPLLLRRPQCCIQARSCVQAFSGLRSLRSLGPWMSHQLWPLQAVLHGAARRSRAWPAWRSARARASRAPRAPASKEVQRFPEPV